MADTNVNLKKNDDTDIILFGNNGKKILARTPNQKRLVDQSNDDDLLFAIGPAGTGKRH